MPATPFSCSFLTLQPRFNSYVNPIFRSLTFQLSSSPLPFNANFSSVRLHSSLSRAAETDSPTGGRSGALTPGPAVAGEVQKIDVNPPKGTRDFPPEDMRLRNWLFNHFKEVSRLYGFEEVDYPVLESEALFTRKAGEEIKDQPWRSSKVALWGLVGHEFESRNNLFAYARLYCFEDRGNRRVALRPELTPSLARLVIQKGKSVSLPIKWFTVGQCWRYERMTRGRRREHYQWNMDIIGVPGVMAEAELIASIVTLFKRIGITESDVGFKVSSRKVEISFSLGDHNLGGFSYMPLKLKATFLERDRHMDSSRIGSDIMSESFHSVVYLLALQVLQEVLNCYSVPENLFGKVCVIIDKIEKIPADEIKKELKAVGLSQEAVQELLQVLSVKSLTELEERLGSSGEAVADLKQLFSLAEKIGYSKWLQFDASVVRGLAYYTGIVFEYLGNHPFSSPFTFTNPNNHPPSLASSSLCSLAATVIATSSSPLYPFDGFDREGKLRAICGGGRYDHLFSTFGADDIAACGFGFGDAVIVELLKEKGLLPELNLQIDDIVCALDEDLQGCAAMVANILREKGQIVELVLESKPLKWVFKRAARLNAERLVLVGNSEWQRGVVGVKILSTAEQYEVKLDDLK
ncbi:Histidine--tRNA ligase, chloroplastic/mitochondrial [Glycine soja]